MSRGAISRRRSAALCGYLAGFLLSGERAGSWDWPAFAAWAGRRYRAELDYLLSLRPPKGRLCREMAEILERESRSRPPHR